MDALVIGPPAGLAAAVADVLRFRGREVLQALPADAGDEERAAWLLAEAGEPPLVVVCEPAPYVAARRLLGGGRRVVVADERRVTSAAGDARPARSAEARALARAAARRGGAGETVRLGRAGRRWVEARSGSVPLSAHRAAAVVLRGQVPAARPAGG
jgi:hypothetical protein